ncbi:CDP-alcohol phosphatidyltransferase family protein (plasmid) [Sinorhizobium numidicum]|uniref:CDP-alcohol phosphatidyltransferase family protein n=1 Tax=Sinorhizobium numidicum TaxID=680248 RepID=A0ABY8D4C8_9HYPH|nr:CDP-alcohol phosphatidyltransferase family protein [Sinorhizobium numidicum]WEX79725.1 CDP-alcohol phosphatidyltransferase family protein [Sinorhizobium numidicum]WEX85709.1 CDP-alcohol phosphatidyltransferase family protein [Sinorhizobium numidicum]
MIKYLFDAANAVTALGLIFATTAIYFAMVGQFEIGICFALWALLADDADGMIAKSSSNRSAPTAQVGAAFDGFADLVYAAVFPAVLILCFNAFSGPAFLAAVCLVLSGALRLSYFSTFGLDADGFSRGLPLNNDLFVLATIFAANRLFVIQQLGAILIGAALILSVLHLSNLKYPGTGNALRLTNLALAAGASIALLATAFTS